jgi:acyl-CoA thioesterase
MKLGRADKNKLHTPPPLFITSLLPDFYLFRIPRIWIFLSSLGKRTLIMDDPNITYAREIVARDPMATFLGIRLEEIRRAYARLSVVIKPEYLNALDRAHGMILSAMIDQAAAVAANSMDDDVLLVELKINYLAAASAGERITAEAKPIDIKKSLSLWVVDVRNVSGSLIATGQALGYHRIREEKEVKKSGS